MIKKQKNKIVVLSGGLDSTILTYYLVKKYKKENIIALTFNYNQKHKYEINKAKITCKKLKIRHSILNISFLSQIIKNVSSLSLNSNIQVPNIKDVLGEPQPSSYVPFRNLIFTSLALSVAESNNANKIYLGLQSHDLYNYWDTSEDFLESLNNISLLNRKNLIKIKAPFVNFSKKEEIILATKLKVPFEDTITCYDFNKNKVSCGVCPSCSERIKNFIDAKIKDPIKYRKKINWNVYLS